MSFSKIPCCFHPTSVVLIDDDEAFLESMSLHLGRDIPCIKFNNPKEALDFLKNQYQADPYINRCLSDMSEGSPQKHKIEVDVKSISEEAYNPNRFQEISTIVVDQVMPGLAGLDLCKELEGLPFKKILLTGKAKQEDVINGFNEAIIHKYIPKDAHDLTDLIKDSVLEMQMNYFDDLSSRVMSQIYAESDKNSGHDMVDNEFIAFFKDLVARHSIKEFYLTDTDGSFLFLDADGNKSILVVKDDESMSSIYEFADFADQKPTPEVLEKIKNKDLILYLHTNKELQLLEPADWEPRHLLFPANKLKGDKKVYYYAYIDDLKSYDLDGSKMLSLHEFLD